VNDSRASAFAVSARLRFWRAFRRYLVAGLLIWLPILATVLVIRFILDLMDRTLLLLPQDMLLRARQLLPESLSDVHVPGLGALLALAILLFTGLLVTNFVGRTLVDWWEEMLHKIPFIRAIYGGVKSFSETLLSNSGNSFKKVLLVQYPRLGVWSIAFQTASDIPEITARTGEPQVCVFVPTTPNPTSGFIFMMPKSQVIELDMSVDAAMKMIVTLGVVTPSAAAAGSATVTAAQPR
jgi:uncharacterized membrane protein